jgi:hypothetical protein
MKYLIIDSRPRSGTHLLQRALNTVPGVHIAEEPFASQYYGHEWTWDWETRPDRWIQWHTPASALIGGTVIQDNQYRTIPILADSVKRLNPCVIILYRLDLLAQFASVSIANVLHNYEVNKPRDEHTITLRPSPSELRTYGEMAVFGVDQSIQRWKDYPHQQIVTYEALVGEWHQCLLDVSNLLEFYVTSAKVTTYKLETRPMRDVVLNYDEAKAILAEYAQQIDEIINQPVS